MGNGGYGQFITCCLCCSFLLTLFPCSNVGSLPGQTVLHELLQCESFPRAAVLQELVQRGSPVGSQVLPANLLQHGLLSMGPQVLPGGCSSGGFPQDHSLLWASICSGLGSYMGCRRISAPLWTYMGCRGTACLTMVFITSCKGKNSLIWRLEYLLPLLLYRPWCLQSCFSCIFSLLSCCNCRFAETFSVLLKYVITEVLPPLLP